MHHHTDKITHTTAFDTPVVEHWLKQEIAQWVHHEGSIRRPIASCYIQLPRGKQPTGNIIQASNNVYYLFVSSGINT